MDDDIRETCLLMNRGLPEHDELTFRGLERRRDEVCGRRKMHRYLVTRAVIESSKQQYNQERIDDDDMGNMCQSMTLPSVVAALERAAKDALEIIVDSHMQPSCHDVVPRI